MTVREWNLRAVVSDDFTVTFGWPLDAILVHRDSLVIARVTGFELSGGFRLERVRDGRTFSLPARTVVAEWEFRDERPDGGADR